MPKSVDARLMGDLSSRYTIFITQHRRWVILMMLVMVGALAAGNVVGTRVKGDIGEAAMESVEQAAQDEIAADYRAKETVEAKIAVREIGGNVLSPDSLLKSLRVQRAILGDATIRDTLYEGEEMIGLENLVAFVAVAEDTLEPDPETLISRRTSLVNVPTIDQQIAALEARTDREILALIQMVVAPATVIPGTNPGEFLPRSYDPGQTVAEARVTRVFQKNIHGMAITNDEIYAAQLAINALVDAQFDDAFVHGDGITRNASTRAVGDSFKIITPIALILLVVVLTVVFRDWVDILISLMGMTLVILCLKGIQAWFAIPATSILIAVPFMLIALSIDYALHVVMRYREAYEAQADREAGAAMSHEPVRAMQVGLAAVLLALVTAALTTAIGFLSNYFSPLRSIRDFGILSSAGIVVALAVFAVLLPAVKVEVERFLVGRGDVRRKKAVGVDVGGVNRMLLGAAGLARRAPGLVVVLSLMVAGVGLYGGSRIDTEFNRTDFLPERAPAWMQWLPKPFAPGEYDVKDNIHYLSDNFRLHGRMIEAQILVHGEVTAPEFLTALEAVAQRSTGFGTLVRESPSFLLRLIANADPSFAAEIAALDDDGDGMPDRDVAYVYDRLFELDPERAAAVIHRTEDGAYKSARLSIALLLNASAHAIAADVRGIAARIEAGAPVTAVATGLPVITAVVQTALFETLVTGFLITLGVILGVLVLLYAWRYRAPGLGVLMLLPVLVALAWLLGTMALLGLPFNSETVVITSLGIGLGVDYSLHLGERFLSERARHDSLPAVLSATLSGTGGALLGCALTTAAGFGVLALAISPPLQRFGIVTGLSIVYTFIACTVLLPSLLVLRERFVQRRSPA
jgi:uncharacterized protein